MPLKLVIYTNNSNAPKPNRPLSPGSCAVLVNNKGKILLHKRVDNPDWSLPGGQMKLGESISQCCLRELKEETNLDDVKIIKLVGVYTSPKIVFKFGNDNIFQSFVVVFLCKTANDNVVLNKESENSKWMSLEEIKRIKTLPFVKKMVSDALTKRGATYD